MSVVGFEWTRTQSHGSTIGRSVWSDPARAARMRQGWENWLGRCLRFLLASREIWLFSDEVCRDWRAPDDHQPG